MVSNEPRGVKAFQIYNRHGGPLQTQNQSYVYLMY